MGIGRQRQSAPNQKLQARRRTVFQAGFTGLASLASCTPMRSASARCGTGQAAERRDVGQGGRAGPPHALACWPSRLRCPRPGTPRAPSWSPAARWPRSRRTRPVPRSAQRPSGRPQRRLQTGHPSSPPGPQARPWLPPAPAPPPAWHSRRGCCAPPPRRAPACAHPRPPPGRSPRRRPPARQCPGRAQSAPTPTSAAGAPPGAPPARAHQMLGQCLGWERPTPPAAPARARPGSCNEREGARV